MELKEYTFFDQELNGKFITDGKDLLNKLSELSRTKKIHTNAYIILLNLLPLFLESKEENHSIEYTNANLEILGLSKVSFQYALRSLREEGIIVFHSVIEKGRPAHEKKRHIAPGNYLRKGK